MKQKAIYITLLCFLSLFGLGQNLVNNPSFEDTVFCAWPTGWDIYSLSPDYFHSCYQGWEFSVPNNWGGYQQAASGVAYWAFGTYLSHSYNGNPVDIREFIGGSLASPLSVGIKYYVSFKVSLSLSDTIEANCASNKMGSMFSTVPYSFTSPAPITNNPHIYTDSIITDTVGWTRVFGSFTADSAYQFIIMGNFFDDMNTDTLIMDTSSYCLFSYYFLDDICVSTDSLFAAQYQYTGIREATIYNSFNVYPNPVKDYVNIESEMLNETYDVRIYNTIGQELYIKKNIQSRKTRIDLSSFNSGLYLIHINSQGKIINNKLFKL